MKVLIPLQLASARVKMKNIRPFYKEMSLFDIKARQLINADLNPSKIYISSEDREGKVESLCQQYGFNFLPRKQELTGNAIKQSELIGFILKQIPSDNDDILWVQVTNPLFDKFTIMLDSWNKIQNLGFDSIVATKTIRHHLISESGIPLNFNFGNWHKVSQDLPKIYEILWSAFLLKRSTIESNQYHIGTKPYYMPFDDITTIDIDTEADFELASKYYAILRGGGG
ncbi:CMP-N-acetylneuraminic acid synthetase [Helicobacter sp. MIT 05-5294]|nr:CMP-N-acetylneuraminic acid synthetase [Helicobacter sp. MIT 05-5294]